MTNLLIYSIEFRHRFADAIFQSFRSALPDRIKDDADKYVRWQDTYNCLLGKVLLAAALIDHGYPACLSELRYNSYGRPYFTVGPDFNISHSGSRVVCVLTDKGKVGVDLEKIEDISFIDLKDQFSFNEWERIINSSNPTMDFYHHWTTKEAVSKAVGVGLNAPFSELEITGSEIMKFNLSQWHILRIKAFSNYACTIATNEIVSKVQIKELSPDQLLPVGNLRARKINYAKS